MKEITNDQEVDFIQYAREQFQANGLDEDYLSPDALQYVAFLVLQGFLRLLP